MTFYLGRSPIVIARGHSAEWNMKKLLIEVLIGIAAGAALMLVDSGLTTMDTSIAGAETNGDVSTLFVSR